MSERTLRFAAIAGFVFFFGSAVATSFPLAARQDTGFWVVAGALLLVPIIIGMTMPRAAGILRRAPALLLPFGVTWLLQSALSGMAAALAFFAATESFTLLSISLPISLFVICSWVLWTVYAIWTTALVLQASRGEPIELARGLVTTRATFARGFVALSVGWIGFMLAVGLIMTSFGVVGIGMALVLMAAWAVVWNLLTSALLPTAVEARGDTLGEMLATGFRRSRAIAAAIAIPLIAQLLLLGLFTYFSVSFDRGPGSHHTATQTNVMAKWTGGYENETAWYGKLNEVLEVEAVPLFDGLLGLLFILLAIAVKLTVVDRLARVETAEPEPVTV